MLRDGRCRTAAKTGNLRRAIGVELNPDYCALAAQRLAKQSLLAS